MTIPRHLRQLGHSTDPEKCGLNFLLHRLILLLPRQVLGALGGQHAKEAQPSSLEPGVTKVTGYQA